MSDLGDKAITSASGSVPKINKKERKKKRAKLILIIMHDMCELMLVN